MDSIVRERSSRRSKFPEAPDRGPGKPEVMTVRPWEGHYGRKVANGPVESYLRRNSGTVYFTRS
jgi:hypothetical protein